MANPRWKQRPEGSTWGDFGPDDEWGRMNLLTPERVLAAVQEVKTGQTFNLSLPLDVPGGNVLNPRRYPPALHPTRRNGRPNLNYQLRGDNPLHTDVVCDDLVVMHLEYSTQWDGLAHVGAMFDVMGDGLPRPVYYNGFRAGVDVVGPTALPASLFDFEQTQNQGTSHAKALGVDKMAMRGVQGRAVMVDLMAHFGTGRTVVGWAELQQVIQADGLRFEPGDFVLFRTGFADALLRMHPHPDAQALEQIGAVINGRDPQLLQWVSDSQVVALIADNYAVEAHPALPQDTPCATLPLHEHCLFKLGVHLGELWHLSPLADWLRAQGRHRCLLTAPPLRLPGAIGSPASPIATV